LADGILTKIYNGIVDTQAVEATTFIGVMFVISIAELLGGVYFFSRKKRKIEESDEVLQERELLCRFVLDGAGRKIGESVAVDNDILIIKSGSKYLGVPIKHIEEEEKTILVKGLVDQDKAELMGERWRKESFSEMIYEEGN